MKKIEQKVLGFIREKNLIEQGDNILVALSGGPDSVFLLHLLNKFKSKLKITIGAIHINHMIRGKEAAGDEEFCRNLSVYLGIQFSSVRKNVKAYAAKNKISVEEAGRILRYKEFDKVCGKLGYNKIATAHNSSDNAETVLLNLIKGTGLKGISGIPAARGTVIRPILNLSKKEILNYLDTERINYRTDISNFSNDYERNYLRNKIIPLIKERLNPDFEKAVFNSSEIFKEAVSFFDNEIEKILPRLQTEAKDELNVPLKSFLKLDKALSGYLIKSLIERNFLVQVSFNDVRKINSLVKKDAGSKTELSNKLLASREREAIVISVNKKRIQHKTVSLSAGESIKVDGKDFSIKKIGKTPDKYTGTREREFISAENISGKFILRNWKEGEKFFPLGLKGSKKISDFLNEQKIPSSKKKEQLVLTNNGKIVWVVGLRLDDRFKITNQTKKVYELWVK